MLYPYTVFFDGSCALCRNEMMLIQGRDIQQQIILCDCSSPDFDDTPFHALGINRQAMLSSLHIRDAQGQWLTGIPAITLLYQTVEMPLFAFLFGSRYTKPIAVRIYPWFARHRHWALWIGLPKLYSYLALQQAQRTHRRTQACHNQQCKR